jgi:RHS repeat-associated protein
MIDVEHSNAVYYYHFDGLGSVTALSDSNGDIVEKYSYDVFGTPTIRDTQNAILSTSAYGNPYFFTGRAYDAETGLYYYRARYYKPSIGRFLQTDPVGYIDSLNLYTYCGNNPIVRLDPYGFDWLDNTANFCAGAGDVVSMGITKIIRNTFSEYFYTDYSSTAYSVGEWTGVGLSVATGVAGGIKAAGVKTVSTEFSHWIPARLGGARSIFNGNYVTPVQHYLQDSYRYIKGWQNIGPKWNSIIQQLARIPNLYKGTAIGIGWGLGGKAMNDYAIADNFATGENGKENCK